MDTPFAVASVEELTNAFKDSLQRKGSLADIRASLRNEVYQCLSKSLRIKRAHNSASANVDDKSSIANEDELYRLSPPMEVKIANYLVMEYLNRSGLHHTLSTFKAEFSELCGNDETENGNQNEEGMITITELEHELDLTRILARSNDEEHFIFENGPTTNFRPRQNTTPLLYRIIHSLRRHN